MLKALRALLGLTPSAMDPAALARNIWEAAAQQSGGTVELQGMKIPVTFSLYSMAKLSQYAEDIQKARQSGRPISYRTAATDLFTAGLSVVGGQLREDGVSFDEWATTCGNLLSTFNGTIQPHAKALDDGRQLHRLGIEVFATAAPRHAPSVQMALGPLIDALNAR